MGARRAVVRVACGGSSRPAAAPQPVARNRSVTCLNGQLGGRRPLFCHRPDLLFPRQGVLYGLYARLMVSPPCLEQADRSATPMVAPAPRPSTSIGCWVAEAAQGVELSAPEAHESGGW